MAPETHTTTLQNLTRGLLGTFMVVAGTGHLTFARVAFQAQVPDWVPFAKDTLVLQSGVVEIGLGLALLFWKRRRVAVGLGLAALYVLVFPGNIHQYTHHISAFGLQPVLIAGALYSTGAWAALRQKK